jgi:hypothetical protein
MGGCYILSSDIDHTKQMAGRLQARRFLINGAPCELVAPFGGFRQSRSKREFGEFGRHDAAIAIAVEARSFVIGGHARDLDASCREAAALGATHIVKLWPFPRTRS